MGLFSRIAGMFGGQSSKMSSEQLWREIYGGRTSRSGVSVNWKNAIEVATVLACVRVIANGVSQVPFRVYQDANGSRSAAPGHPAYALLYRRPNAWQTSFEFRETLMYHVLLTGNAFVWKGVVGRERQLRRLEIIEPGRVTVKRNETTGSLTYVVRGENGQSVDFMQDEIWHVRGPSWNSWMGMETVALARDAIGLSMATEAAHAEFHRGGARVSGLLSVKDPLAPDRFEFLSAWLDKYSDGGERSGKPLILDRGATWTQMQMTGVDAQHLETRKHQIEEICRAFGVMPIMVGHADKTATYASAEQMFLAHVVHTLSPWYERIEESADINLLTPDDREAGYYTKFTPNGLMRGAAKDRGEFYAKALGAGSSPAWMTPNEVRALEEMDGHPDGDTLFRPPVNAAAGADAPAQE